jgi:hypothetical protein
MVNVHLEVKCNKHTVFGVDNREHFLFPPEAQLTLAT